MILVVAWDGTDLGLVEPWMASGELPNLAAAVERGATRALASTRPPVTFPAWTSFLTAATPDHHGIPDFTIRDGYRVRFANAADRRVPTIFARMSAAGLRVGTYAVPATYPPEPLSGFQIPGFDTPFGASPGARYGHPPELVDGILARHGTLAIDGPSQATIEAGWHERALPRLLASIERRADIFAELLAAVRLDCAMVHFIESDTVSHQFRHLSDPRSPRFALSALDGAMLAVYRALDAALGRLVETLDDDDTLMLVSDHGSAATSDRAIFWNRWLADHGLLAYSRSASVARSVAAAKRVAGRWIPAGLHARLFASLGGVAGRIESAARFAGIDWNRTRVFSEELAYQPSFWVNLRGREPVGIVTSEEVPSLLAALTKELLEFRDPWAGRPIVKRVWRRDELFEGAYSERMPDLVVELESVEGAAHAAGASKGGFEREAIRRLRADEMTGARGTSMPGCHAQNGLCVLAGPRVEAGRYEPSAIEHAGATLLALAGVTSAAEMNGIPWRDCFVGKTPLCAAGVSLPVPTVHADAAPYSGSEEALVAERLRALGYLE